jgi:hypothetical protein
VEDRPHGEIVALERPEVALDLMADAATIASASHDDLIYLVTTILRGERFSDGEITSAYERGTLLAIAQRAQALLDGELGVSAERPARPYQDRRRG